MEGTILSVSRDCADAAVAALDTTGDIVEIVRIATVAAQESLARTPELLPQLKAAGVVDSGGMGLLTIYKGMYKGLIGEEIDGATVEQPEVKVDSAMEHADIMNLGTIEFGYCTEFFIINLKRRTTLADIDRLREYRYE